MCSFSNKVWQNPNKALEQKENGYKSQKPVITDKLL